MSGYSLPYAIQSAEIAARMEACEVRERMKRGVSSLALISSTAAFFWFAGDGSWNDEFIQEHRRIRVVWVVLDLGWDFGGDGAGHRHGVLELIWASDTELILDGSSWVCFTYGVIGFLAYWFINRSLSGLIWPAFLATRGG